MTDDISPQTEAEQDEQSARTAATTEDPPAPDVDDPDAGADQPVDDRVTALERRVAALADRIEPDQAPTGGDRVDRSHWSRRSVLGALGIAGLAGLGVGTASADPQGQVGTQSDPLAGLYTTRVESPLDELFLLVNGSFVGTLVNDGTRADVLLGTNAGTGGQGASSGRTVAGGVRNIASGNTSAVGGGIANTASGLGSTVGGGADNEATHHYTTVAGGRENVASFDLAAIGGGRGNVATGGAAAIGAGYHNEAAGYGAVVAGGGSNVDDTRGNAAYSNHTAVGGGIGNEAGVDGQVTQGEAATVGGGKDNEASAAYATVPGGDQNVADGNASLAAGRLARTNGHDGAFVWGDGSTYAVTAQARNEFVVQAGGGVRIFSHPEISRRNGVELPRGSGSWSSLSARASKSDVDPVDPEAVLAGVEDLDVSRWSYDAQAGVRHMGPMAESFHDAFGLGEDEHRISTVDADGVALGAIQGLAKRDADRAAAIEEQAERIEELEAEVDAKGARLADRDDRIAAQGDRLDSQADRIDALEAENAELRERLAALESALERSPDGTTAADGRDSPEAAE